MSFQPIENYGVIGNMRSLALVGMNGSIDFLCYPDFDSPTVFAALLDDKAGGRFQIEPQLTNARIRQLYLPETNILLTRFLAEEGVAELTDYMPIEKDGEQPNEIIRTISVIRGNVHFKMCCQPRFNYGTSPHQTVISDHCATFLPAESRCPPMALYSSATLQQQAQDVISELTLAAGGTATFILGGLRPQGQQPEMEFVGKRFHRTSRFWKSWIAKSKYKGRWREMVNRSALMLKLLISREYGSLIAAPTFSLPESIGGVRNWDYRFTWLRDATFTLYALIRLGFVDETEAFIDWLKGRVGDYAERGPLQVMYGIDGRQKLEEMTLDHLSGYENSRPVRIGNAARDQLQLDVYGEVIDAAAQFAFHGGRLDQEMQRALIGFGDYVAKNWDEPDEGIWEPRSGRANHTHSRLLCWTAMDRLVRLSERGMLQRAPIEDYKRISNSIRRQIEERAWNKQMQSYVSVLDSDQLDSSLLLLSWYGFEEAGSARMRGTYLAIRQHLSTPDGLLFRYQREKPEGTFAICSFWEVEYLAMGGGSLEEARQLFGQLMKYKNDLGLYGEEIDANTGAALGNFPQAFTHVGLIGAALSIDQREKGERQLAHRPPAAAEHSPAEATS